MDKIYIDLRNMALSTTPEDVSIRLENNEQVYAALIDMRLKKGKASLFCAIDGTVSLYFDNANCKIGLGESEKVKNAAMSLLLSSGQCLNIMKKTDDFSFRKETLQVFLFTKEGKYEMEINPKYMQEREKQFLNFLVQNLLKAIRKS